MAFEQQKRINVDYKGRNIGNLIADLIVEDRVIVEVKSIKELAPIHTAQLITYLKVTKIRSGLLINFNVVRLKDGIKRIVF
ncbi:MAG: GxxExxY protein [Chloroflexota bacterium]|nr:GxxExxY protein [Chloroflexota bacterium]